MSIFPYLDVLSSLQYVRLWIIGGAINARVEELIEPTKLINKSSFGMAAASATENKNYTIRNTYIHSKI